MFSFMFFLYYFKALNKLKIINFFMPWKPGEGLYAELGDDGKLKSPILKKEDDKFVDTGYDLTSEQKQKIESGQPVTPTGTTTTARRSRRRRTTTKPEPVKPIPKPEVHKVDGEVNMVTIEDRKNQQSKIIYKPGEVTTAEDVAGVGRRDVVVDYSGEFYKSPYESDEEFEERRRRRLQQLADAEAQRFAKDSPGQEVSVELRYSVPYLEEKKETKPELYDFEPYSPVEDSNKKYFGTRAPGRETISTTPTYQVYTPEPKIADTIPQKAVLTVGKIIRPNVFKNIAREDFQEGFKSTPLGWLERKGQEVSAEFKNLEVDTKRQEDRRKGVTPITGFFEAIGKQKTADYFKGREQKYFDLVDSFEKIVVKVVGAAGDVFIGQTISDPISATALAGGGAVIGRGAQFAKPFLSSQAGQITSVSLGAGMGGLAIYDIATSDDPLTRSFQIGKEATLVSVGFHSGFNIKPSTQSFTSVDKKNIGQPWSAKDEFLVLSPAEAQIQRAGIQRTLQGGMVSDANVYQIRLSAGVDPLKKSPLGIDDFYTSIRPSAGKGSNLRLDESFGFPRMSLTESGQPVLTGTGSVGTKTTRLDTRTIRAVDTRTGKEYNIPAEFLEQRLIEQPSLSVIGEQPRQLFSMDPVSAAIYEFSRSSSITSTPRLTKSSNIGGGQTVIQPRPTSQFRPSFAFSPSLVNFRVESPLSNDVFVDSRADSRRDVDSRFISVFGSGLVSLSREESIVSTGVDKISGVSSRSGTRSGSRTISRVGTGLVPVPDVPVFSPPVQVPKITTRTSTWKDPRIRDPTPRPGFNIPRFNTSFKMSPRDRVFGSDVLPRVVSARPGSRFVFAPGSKRPGEVRFLRPGRRLSSKKKKLFGDEFNFRGVAL